MKSLADSPCLKLLPGETIFPSSARQCYSPRQKQLSLMHWAENISDSQADLQADQMSLPWGLPYLLKAQGKADGWGCQQLQPAISCGKSVRSQTRTNLYSLMILHALLHSFPNLLSIKLFNFCLSSVVSLSFSNVLPFCYICSEMRVPRTERLYTKLGWGIQTGTTERHLKAKYPVQTMSLFWPNSMGQRYLTPFMFTAVVGLKTYHHNHSF